MPFIAKVDSLKTLNDDSKLQKKKTNKHASYNINTVNKWKPANALDSFMVINLKYLIEIIYFLEL